MKDWWKNLVKKTKNQIPDDFQDKLKQGAKKVSDSIKKANLPEKFAQSRSKLQQSSKKVSAQSMQQAKAMFQQIKSKYQAKDQQKSSRGWFEQPKKDYYDPFEKVKQAFRERVKLTTFNAFKKMAIICGIGFFAYGLGKTIPVEIRKYYQSKNTVPVVYRDGQLTPISHEQFESYKVVQSGPIVLKPSAKDKNRQWQ